VRKVTAVGENVTVELIVGKNTAFINGESVVIDAPALIQADRTPKSISSEKNQNMNSPQPPVAIKTAINGLMLPKSIPKAIGRFFFLAIAQTITPTIIYGMQRKNTPIIQ
jgi:hypothetical protein